MFIGKATRPRCSSIASSQIEITEMRRLPPNSALRIASSAARERRWIKPSCAQIQQWVSRSRRSLGIRFPRHINGRDDVADNIHGALHASDEALLVIVQRDQLRHWFA